MAEAGSIFGGQRVSDSAHKLLLTPPHLQIFRPSAIPDNIDEDKLSWKLAF